MAQFKELSLFIPSPADGYKEQRYILNKEDPQTWQVIIDIQQLDQSNQFQITLEDDARYIVSSPFFIYLETPRTDGYIKPSEAQAMGGQFEEVDNG